MQKPRTKNYKPDRQQKVYNVTVKEKEKNRKYNKQDDLYKIEITFYGRGLKNHNLKTLGHWRDHPEDVEAFLEIVKADVKRDIKKMLFPGSQKDNEIITTFREICNKIARSLPNMPKARTLDNITASFLTADTLDRFVAEFNKQYRQAESLPGDNRAMDKLIKHHQELKNRIDGIIILDR